MSTLVNLKGTAKKKNVPFIASHWQHCFLMPRSAEFILGSQQLLFLKQLLFAIIAILFIIFLRESKNFFTKLNLELCKQEGGEKKNYFF